MRGFKTIISAGFLASALVLAGCGGGSDDDVMDDMTQSDADEMARSAANTAIMSANTAADALDNMSSEDDVSNVEGLIMDARTAIGMVPKGEQAELTLMLQDAHAAVNKQRGRLEEEQRQADMNREEADKLARAAVAAAAKTLHAGLGVGSVDLDNAVISISATGAVTGASDGSTTDAEFKMTKDMVPTHGNWAGGKYRVKASGMTDEAAVYSNRDSSMPVPFSDKWGDATDGVADIIDENGDILQNNLTGRASLIAGADFASGSGGKNHTKDANDNVRVSGTFDGGSGLYQCDQSSTTACRSQVDGEGGIILSGGWTFTPASGAMVPSAPSGDYVAYGWWSRTTSKGVDVMAFQDDIGTAAPASTTNTVTGTATYSGGAAGQYAIYNPLDDGDSDSGEFTASAMLTAKFGNATDEGTVDGALTNFMASDGPRPWMVTLNSGDADNIAAGVISGGTTVWKINDTAADAGGNWSGNFYNPAPAGNAGDAPMTAAGTFTSVYGDGVGRMIGAFGASKQ